MPSSTLPLRMISASDTPSSASRRRYTALYARRANEKVRGVVTPL